MNNMSMMPNDDEQKRLELEKALTHINQTPPTDYSFYKDVSAEDRAKLADAVMKQQSSGGNMIASGAAGLGDAIANSYGGKNTTFQKDVRAGAQKRADQVLSNFDTQRGQKMQDYQANTQLAEQDPNSPLSQQTRDFFIQQGIQVPSGMNYTQLKTLAPSIADLSKGKWEQAFRQSQLDSQNAIAEQSAKDRELQLDIQRQGMENQAAAQRQAAGDRADDNKKANLDSLNKMPWYSRAMHSDEADMYKKGAGLDMAPMSFDDKEKEQRYQEWKAKQGR